MTAIQGDDPLHFAGNTASIIIPCLNEEAKLRVTAEEIIFAARRRLSAFEILFVDDGSTDGTHQIMQDLAAEYPECHVMRNDTPKGLSNSFRYGLAAAKYEYVTLLPGDYAFNISGIELMFSRMGAADLIATYRINQKEARSKLRFIFTVLFQWVMMILFRLPLKDVHSINAYSTAALRRIVVESEGAGFQIETLVKLFRANSSSLIFIQVPVSLNQDKFANNRTLSWKTFFTLLNVLKILWFGAR